MSRKATKVSTTKNRKAPSDQFAKKNPTKIAVTIELLMKMSQEDPIVMERIKDQRSGKVQKRRN